jgi:hypothetical protein
MERCSLVRAVPRRTALCTPRSLATLLPFPRAPSSARPRCLQAGLSHHVCPGLSTRARAGRRARPARMPPHRCCIRCVSALACALLLASLGAVAAPVGRRVHACVQALAHASLCTRAQPQRMTRCSLRISGRAARRRLASASPPAAGEMTATCQAAASQLGRLGRCRAAMRQTGLRAQMAERAGAACCSATSRHGVWRRLAT